MRHYSDYADKVYLEPMGPAHLLPWGDTRSLCGVVAQSVDWYGTGDWDEREHAEWLTPCVTCIQRANGTALPGKEPSTELWRQVGEASA